VACTGDTIDGKTLAGISNTVINDNGDIVFVGFFNDPDFLSGIFRILLNTPTSFVVGAGDTIDGKTLGAAVDPAINDNGDIVFLGFIDPDFSTGIFTPTSCVACPGDTIDGKTLGAFNVPAINDNGDIVFAGFFSPTFTSGIFTPTSCVACTGDTIDGKTLIQLDPNSIGISDNGNIVFLGFFSSSGGIFTHTQVDPLITQQLADALAALAALIAEGTIISSDFDGNLDVGAGQTFTIKDEATVSGNVIVDGGKLNIKGDSTVTGDVDVKNGGSLDMDDGNVSGNVKVTDGNEVKIENSDINGDLTIEAFSGSCNESDNTVNGNNSGCP